MATRPRSFSTQALVLKRSNTGEYDRVVTLLSQSHGKFVAVAKGARKLHSTKRSLMEPGSLITAHLVLTKSLPLLTQARANDTTTFHSNLSTLRQLQLTLEIFDALFVEEELEADLFESVLAIRSAIFDTNTPRVVIRNQLTLLLEQLGYVDTSEQNQSSVSSIVQELTDKPLRSWGYLSVTT